jgi:hypothetical protein
MALVETRYEDVRVALLFLDDISASHQIRHRIC